MCLSLFPHWIWSSIRLILCRWSGASRSYGIHLYRESKLLDCYSRDVSSFLSHPLDACHQVCGIALNSAKLAYRSKCTRYPASFRRGTRLLMVSTRFPVFLVIEHSGLSFTESFSLALIAYQKLPLFLNLGFWLPICIHAWSPWANG